ncbi:hypothetical protein HHK36_007053 [Tetracentron sinense]|uniref:Uncharacterized protein n=1 Tax=Tetracentron sinense TaxID=13715 RepID=A0A834ZI75_TETSI|nr:hypothetical protein HHK36_007053 [Tetracentron sinense]
MESSQHLGGTEECSSNESGWTMYIASPMHDDADNDDYHDSSYDDGDDDGHNNDSLGGEKDYKSDDSMASDACSGPSNRKHPRGNGEGGHGMAHFKHDEDKDDKKYSSCKKDIKQVKKKKRDESKAEKEDSKHKANRAAAPVQSDAKGK